MNILFLDDDAQRCRDFRANTPSAIIVQTAKACIEELGRSPWDVVFLDHDLGGEQYVAPEHDNTGSAVVRWIIENKPKVETFVVHSFNTDAAKWMVHDLEKAGYEAFYQPFDSFALSIFCQ